MKKSVRFVLLSVLVFALAACQPATPAATEAATQAAQEGGASAVKAMEGAALLDLINNKDLKDATLIIDVRSNEEYLAGHLANAINIPVDELDARTSEVEDFKEKPVIVYCNTGKKSAEAGDKLVAAGFTDVTNGQGVKEFEYPLYTHTDIRATTFLEMMKDPDVVIVDYRPAKNFNEGHIENAIHIELDQVPQNLDKLPKDKKIVFYCNTGTQSLKGADALVKEGYTNVYNVIEGTKEFDYTLVK